MSNGIPEGLRSYLPTSLFQADGTTLKDGVDAKKAIEVAQGIQAKADALPPTEAKLFLAIVGAADIAPNGQIPTDIDQAIEKFAEAASLVATLAISGNALDYLARVMIEQAGEQRKSALGDRLAAREIAKGELLSQAGKLKEEAEKLSSGALQAMIVSVVMSAVAIVGAIASGVASGISAVKQVGAAKGALSAMEGTPAAGTAKAFEVATKFSDVASKSGKILGAVGQSAGSVAQTANQLGQGVSGYLSTDSQAAGKVLESEGQIDAAQAQEAQASGDIRKEQQEALNQMVQSIIQFLKDLKDAQAQHMQVLTKV